MVLAVPLLCAPLLAASGTAQVPVAPLPDDTMRLPDLIVTATRVPLPREALPTPVTVLTGEAIRQQGIRTVAEALQAVPSASIVQAGPAGAQTSLFLRGGQSGYVKVLVDGVAVNDAGGAIDLADLTTDQVDRIEVVRGPVSVLYGSDAVAGVVQIFTRRGTGAPALAASTLGGLGERRHEDQRYGTADAEASVAGSTGNMGYLVGASRSWNEGAYPFNSDRRIDVLNGRVDWTGRPGSWVTATARFSDSDTGFPTDGAGNLVDHNARLERRSLTAGLEAGGRLADRVAATVQLGLLDRHQSALDEPDGPADTLGVYASRLDGSIRRVSADARLDIDLPASIASLGVVVQDQRGSSAYTSESEWGPTEAHADFRRRNRGYYAQVLSEPLPGLHITAGVRLDDNDVFGTFLTQRLGLTYGLGATRVRAAAGRGFREPTFAESFGSGFGDHGNPALVPERSRSRELGIDQRLGDRLSLGATWFDQRFEDMIQYTFSTPDPADPNYFNVGAATASGLELSAEASHARISLAASYTRLRTRVVDPGLATDASFAEGESLIRRPAHSGSLTGRYRLPDGALGVIVNRVGAREDLDFAAGFPAPRVTLDPYTTVDLSAEHRVPAAVGPRWDVLLRVRNTFDARYEAVRGFPAPGRVISAGVRMRL